MKKKLFDDDFFVPIQGELYNALEHGELTPVEWCVYTMMLRQLNFETGVWNGSAYRIAHDWSFQIPQRTIQSAMKRLCDSGRLKSFHVKGDKKDYPVAIHGYKIRSGKWAGHVLDANATKNPNNPVYVYPQKEQPVPPDDGSESATPVQDQRRENETSTQEQRSVTAASPYPNARNTLDIPDGSYVLEKPDVRDEREREERSGSRSRSVSQEDSDVERLVEIVKTTSFEADERAQFSGKSVALIRQVIASVRPTERVLISVTRDLVQQLDEFQLKNAGRFIAESLGPRIKVRQNELRRKEEQARQMEIIEAQAQQTSLAARVLARSKEEEEEKEEAWMQTVADFGLAATG